MAKIEFEAFVEDVLSGASGVFGLKTAETHSRKDENGKWQTVARTFRTVKASRESGVAWGGLSKGDKVFVTGTEKTEAREWQGKKLYDLVVWADTVGASVGRSGVSQEPVEGSWEPAVPVSEPDTWSGAAQYDTETTPF